MNKGQTLTSINRREQLTRFGLAALVMAVFIAFTIASGVLPAFADIELGGLDTVMDIVVTIISKAALYVGIVIILWGVFQIVMALRREDSEAIGKQITTVVVGGVLVGFGAIAESLYSNLVG